MGEPKEVEYRPEVDYCYERAALCARIAGETDDARPKEFLFKLEELWRNVAASYVFKDDLKAVARAWEDRLKSVIPGDRKAG
jgi:hypothetical protein